MSNDNEKDTIERMLYGTPSKEPAEMSKEDRERLKEYYYSLARIGADSVAELIEKAEAGDAEAKERLAIIGDEDQIKELTEHFKDLRKAIEDYVEENGAPEPVADVITVRPKQFITPVDKISNKAFEGVLNNPELLPVAMERRGSKKDITTMVSINFDEAQAHGLIIRGRKELTAYDREIHDAITSLYIDGANEYITTSMIYQTITGNTGDWRRLTPKASQAISESITKLMYSRLIIDATEEAQAFYKGLKLSKDSPLLPAERVTATLNGQVQECVHILKAPPLYEYAEAKGQLGRVELKLLNSPINKNEEIITLQGYLMRRILSIKGSSKLSPSIVYETIYKQIDVSAETPGALRKKKTKVRGQVKQILDYWKQEGFIKGYVENKHGQEIYSVTIRY